MDVKEPGLQDDEGTKWYQPFPHEIKAFPVHATRSQTGTGTVPIEDPTLFEKIRPGFPEFAPFPPMHTYKKTDSNSRKRGRGSSDSVSSKSRQASSVKSIQKSLSRIEDAVEAEQLKRRRGTSILADDEVKNIIEKSKTEPAARMIDVPGGGGKMSTFDINKVSQEKIQSLTYAQKLLSGIKE